MPTPFYTDDFPPYSLEITLKKSANALCVMLHRLERNFDFAGHLKNIRAEFFKEALTPELLILEAKNTDREHKAIAPYKVHFRHACIFFELASISPSASDRPLLLSRQL
ncbi:hypothetical protein [Pseudomonas viridiflava]|uniref:hypothetical protein n=1 Tax=Pseudomonas viridiflava TaxID=33069 RepID=UPI000F061541|nr:hypothetical protein [Pseudomonas viridiflava]